LAFLAGLAEMGELGGDASENVGLEWVYVVQDTAPKSCEGRWERLECECFPEECRGLVHLEAFVVALRAVITVLCEQEQPH